MHFIIPFVSSWNSFEVPNVSLKLWNPSNDTCGNVSNEFTWFPNITSAIFVIIFKSFPSTKRHFLASPNRIKAKLLTVPIPSIIFWTARRSVAYRIFLFFLSIVTISVESNSEIISIEWVAIITWEYLLFTSLINFLWRSGCIYTSGSSKITVSFSFVLAKNHIICNHICKPLPIKPISA